MKPEEAFAAALAEVARRRAAGGYGEPAEGLHIDPVDRVTHGQLLEWALLDPDVSKLRSTRRLGAPITGLKRLLLRGLQQYHNELLFEQTRMNIHLLRRIIELEERIEELEQR